MAARRKKQNRRRSNAPPRFVFRRAYVEVPLRWLSISAAALLLVFGLGLLLNRPISSVQIDAPFQRVTAMQIEAAVREALVGGLLTLDLKGLRLAVSNIPWVDRVRVQRRWPGAISVRVSEQVAAARWRETGLLNTRGELFISDARHIPAELPWLSGPEDSEWQVAQRYLTLRRPLLESGFNIAALSMDARGAWQLRLDNGVQVRLGRDATDRRVQRFLTLATPVISSRMGDVAYVDMRYSNGFAVGWKALANADETLSKGEDSDV